ncbi:MAG TPA: ester cyclase [Candidatus Acidoferrales bacterium]|nr:ester cyclase [Candidatus Acidoferrales bacterium]
MSEGNKNAVRHVFDEVWNKNNVALIEQLFAPTYTHHDPSSPDVGRGPEGYKKLVAMYRGAFPDLRFTYDDLVAEGETVSVRWSTRATHKGDLHGIKPTGKEMSISGISVCHFAGGKIVDEWVNWDSLGMLQQLGVVPQLASAKVAAR